MPLNRVASALALALALAACSAPDAPEITSSQDTASPSSDTPTGPPVPGSEWDRTAPADAGFDPDALARLDRRFGSQRTNCFAVVRDGELVHFTTFDGEAPDAMGPAFSVTKSFTSVLVGIAADQGLLDLDDRAARYIPAWRDTPAGAVTIRDLLANVSGRHWDVETDYQEMALQARDKTAFAVGLSQDAAPGTVWHYNNAAIQTLEAVLSAATGEEPAEYARQHLLRPLQMSRTYWGTDRAGNTTTYAGVNASCLDLARFGLMMMRDGAWGDQQIVSADYVEEATGGSSSDLNAAYGLLWWVNRKGTVLGALPATGAEEPGTGGATRPAARRLAPQAPRDAFWALGLGKQIVAVIPSEGIVAVRMGTTPDDPDALSPDDFTSAVLDAQR
ncbi:CubicO group peptidase (beta-lactamase class C family) [Mumia flava]|uniref:CubicO group peptidase (Beta-lactamase class C family) n=1 Tax=Mumia flava TaxID=1348852 RepID=A0A0B2BIF2_9ACTN|nr:serine hydrolase domain-containing protein [Mumia flava]PJJ58279.1 CubicO group peptidase (beta-lactamase class C family) [Mumia flava]